MRRLNLFRQPHWLALIFLILVPTTAHFGFSWMGFNPTDDGFILAYSRRLLEGQAPHRDFISIRPTLSPLIHLPLVAWGGDYTYWLSRWFVWAQFAMMAWSWVVITQHYTQLHFNPSERLCLGLLAFIGSAHNFPPMAWHTIDALWLTSLGLALFIHPHTKLTWWGSFLLGAAVLCRQNFLLVAPCVFILTRRWRDWANWLAALLPSLLYVAYLVSVGGLMDAVVQLTTQTDLLWTGVLIYLVSWLGLPLWLGATSLFNFYYLAFFLFGWVMLITLRDARHKRWSDVSFGLLVLVCAWSTSVSLGYNTPALAAGPLGLFILARFKRQATQARLPFFATPITFSTALGLLTIISCLGFVVWRSQSIYKEQPAQHLTYTLATTLPGGRLIYTNANTAAFMADLQTAIHHTNGQRYAIVPDIAGYWVKAPQVNPLPLDWAQGVELNQPALAARVTAALERQRGQLVIIVQRVAAGALAERFAPLPTDDFYTVVNYVRRHFTLIERTTFFDVYQ
jgi:hypothetical protein